MPRSQAHGHRRGRAQAPLWPRRRARERFRDQVALKFLLKNSPWTWAGQWTRAPDGGDLNVNTLFFHGPPRHGLWCAFRREPMTALPAGN